MELWTWAKFHEHFFCSKQTLHSRLQMHVSVYRHYTACCTQDMQAVQHWLVSVICIHCTSWSEVASDHSRQQAIAPSCFEGQFLSG